MIVDVIQHPEAQDDIECLVEEGQTPNVTADKVVRLLPPLVIREEEAKLLVSILAPIVKAFLAESPAAAAA